MKQKSIKHFLTLIVFDRNNFNTQTHTVHKIDKKRNFFSIKIHLERKQLFSYVKQHFCKDIF